MSGWHSGIDGVSARDISGDGEGGGRRKEEEDGGCVYVSRFFFE